MASTTNIFTNKSNIALLETGLEALSITPLSCSVHVKINLEQSLDMIATDIKHCVIHYYEEMGYSFSSKIRKIIYALHVFKTIKSLYQKDKAKAQDLIDFINNNDDHHYISIKYKVLYRVGSRINHLIIHCTISGLCLLKVLDCEYIYDTDSQVFSVIVEELVHVSLVNKKYRIHPSYPRIINPIVNN